MVAGGVLLRRAFGADPHGVLVLVLGTEHQHPGLDFVVETGYPEHRHRADRGDRVCVPVDVGAVRGLVHNHHPHPLTIVSRRCKPTGPHDSDPGPMTRSVCHVRKVSHAAPFVVFVCHGHNI